MAPTFTLQSLLYYADQQFGYNFIVEITFDHILLMKVVGRSGVSTNIINLCLL